MNPKQKIWNEIKIKYKLSSRQVQMAMKLGLNPKKIGKLVPAKNQQWKSSLPEFIEELYAKRFEKNTTKNIPTKVNKKSDNPKSNKEVKRKVFCPYCNQEAQLKDSNIIYDKSYGNIWICFPCNAYVGVHKDCKNFTPLGRLANAELREWKKKAHAAFDPLWQEKIRIAGCSKTKARQAGYEWLSKKMDLELEKCHIGMFDTNKCKKVVKLCAPYIEKIRLRGQNYTSV